MVAAIQSSTGRNAQSSDLIAAATSSTSRARIIDSPVGTAPPGPENVKPPAGCWGRRTGRDLAHGGFGTRLWHSALALGFGTRLRHSASALGFGTRLRLRHSASALGTRLSALGSR